MSYEDAMDLEAFLAAAGGRIDLAGRQAILDQATVVLEQLYAHLPLKRAMFAIDPLQRLRLLRRRLPAMSELGFHREMLSIFAELRDMHTAYTLPEPFQSHLAVLPFLVEEFYEGEARRYMVSKVSRSVADPHFRRGARVTHWNGVPIERAVELSAAVQAGGNEAAGRARGLAALTLRPLPTSPWPDEAWVVVSYMNDDGAPLERRFDWRVIPAGQSWIEDGDHSTENPETLAGGIDRRSEAMRRARKTLFAPEAVDEERRQAALRDASGGSGPADPGEASRLPDNFSFRTVETPRGSFGYLRIWSFENTTGGAGRKGIDAFVDAFVDELLRILATLPPDGLILDVRSNPGGRIPAGERVLELLTPATITGASMHFRSTALVEELCRLAPVSIELQPWQESVARAVETGAVYSDGHPFLPFARAYNRLGQRYHGPVVLVVDALCYSTTDIFAAGFQDHAVGPILGVAERTGAGGANVWPHEAITRMLQGSPLSALKPLPGGASFTVALRQAVRVGPRAGVPLEDLGVTPDLLHRTTRNDLLNQNEDLIARAAEILATLPLRALSGEVERRAGGRLGLSITTRSVPRVDVYLDDRPLLSLDTLDGVTAAELACPNGGRLDLRGFDGTKLVGQRRIEVAPPE